MIEIRAASGRSGLRRFVDYAYERNAADPHWVPPIRLSEIERLTPSKNPFFAHADVELLLAWRDGRVAGRVAAIDDRLHNEKYGDNVAMFGFFEAADAAAATTLLGAVETWARARGRAGVRGPINPSLNESAGLLIDGFDTDPMILMPHNPPEYAGFIESAGYRKVKDLYAWLWDLDREPPAVLGRLAARVQQRHRIAVRPLNLSEFTREVALLRRIYAAAWDRNWGFVAPTEAEFERIAKEMKPIFDPRCAVLAEVDGRAVACAIAIPDVNQAMKGTTGRLSPATIWRLLMRHKYINQARLLLLGVEPEYRSVGLYPVLVMALRDQTRGGPYRRVEFSWILEDNRDINQPAEQAGARRYKTYRIYEKAIG